MTEQEKAKRRAMIQEQASKPARQVTYWLTRDKDMDGNLENMIDVWLSQPSLHVLPGGGVTWICDDVLVPTANGDCPARYTQWTKEQCLRACYVFPETERECIRVGE